MFKIFGYFFIAILLYSLNEGFLINFQFFGALPNLLLLLIIYIALEDGSQFNLFFSFFCGLLLDFSTGFFLGGFSLYFLLMAAVLQAINSNFVDFGRNWKFLPLVLLGSQAGLYAWLMLINFIGFRLGQSFSGFVYAEFMRRFFFEAAYNLIFFYPVWKFASLPGKLEAKFSAKSK